MAEGISKNFLIISNNVSYIFQLILLLCIFTKQVFLVKTKGFSKGKGFLNVPVQKNIFENLKKVY